MNHGRPDPVPGRLGPADRDLGTAEASRNEFGGTAYGTVVQVGRVQGNVTITPPKTADPGFPVPAQLPPAPASFTGRSDEMVMLDAAVAQHDPARALAVAVLTGSGGIGKTALATTWLHQASGRYRGGTLYADLKGHGEGTAASPADVLAGFLRALGIAPARIPAELAELAALFRTVTSGQPTLIFLDNARSAAQVRALLPGPGRVGGRDDPAEASMVLVTTRWRLAGLATDGARFIDIGPLDEESAVELFAGVAGADRAAADPAASRSVARMCAGLPLALCITGALAVSRPRRPLARLAADLEEQRRRLGALTADDLSVSSAFDATYHALPAAIARGYRMLAVIPGADFSPAAAAACAGLDAGQAEDLLDALTGASLLLETSDQRFRYHDLVRLHALQRGRDQPGDEPRAAAVNVITWYLEQAVAADLVVIPGRWRLNPMYERARARPPAFASPSEALEWLESEQDCLCSAVTASSDLGLAALSWQLCEALWGLFANRKYFRPWIRTHEAGIEAARDDGNRRAEARMRMQLGLAFRHLRQFGKAREQYTLALALDQAENHRVGEATELEQLGLTDLAEGRHDAAIREFALGKDIFKEIGVPRGAAMMTCHIGEAHRDGGRYREAIRDLAEARSMFAALPDPYNEARTVAELGRAHLSAGDHVEAERLLTTALDAMTSLDSPYEQARIRVVLAGISDGRGDESSARSHLELALAVYDALGAPEAEQVRTALSVLGVAPDSGVSGPDASQ